MHLIAYHNVVGRLPDFFDRKCSRIHRDRFAGQMRHLRTRYRPVSLPAWLKMLDSDRPDPLAVAVTFDDGYAGVFEQALPVMAELGIPGTVFLTTERLFEEPGRGLFHFEEIEIAFRLTRESRLNLDFLGGPEIAVAGLVERAAAMKLVKKSLKVLPEAERVRAHRAVLERLGVDRADCLAYAEGRDRFRLLSRPQIEELVDRGWSVGSHSRSHRTLSRLEPVELAAEIEGSRDDLIRELGLTEIPFAYPFGEPEHIGPLPPALVEKAGYTAGLTASPGPNPPGADRFLLRRGEWHQFILSSRSDR